MGFFSLRRWLQRQPRSSRRATLSRPRPAFRTPSLEILEARLAPATHNWLGTAGDGNWASPSNWQGGSAPTGGLDSDGKLGDLVFGAAAPPAQRITHDNLSGALTFNSITISAGGYSMDGTAFTLGSVSATGATGFVTVGVGALNNTIALNVKLGSKAGTDQFFTVNLGAKLTISGQLSGSTGSSLTKEGTGILVLSGDNSAFTGPIKLDNNAGIVVIANANALGSVNNSTTVGTNAQLQVAPPTGQNFVIAEPLNLNGPGASNDGALLNVSGTNTWTGDISLDSDTSLGSAAGSLTITSRISDLGAGHNLNKEGPGQIVFTHANTYRGLTTINNGILTITNPAALGNVGSPNIGTLVNSNLAGQGTLQLSNTGIVNPYPLTLNGGGAGGIGALENIQGNNTWTGNVTLGSPSPNGNAISIGAAGGTNLLVSGVIADPAPGNGPYGLSKVETGRLIFTNGANSFLDAVTVKAGMLNVEDSQALGPIHRLQASTPPYDVEVQNGAALELQLQQDNIFGLVPTPTPDSIMGNLNHMTFDYTLDLNGTGVGNTGALHSVSGINIWGPTGGIGTIQMNGLVPTPNICAIGVDADPHESSTQIYFTNDYSLTISNDIGGTAATTLEKVDPGHLILTNGNSYQGPTDIKKGWVTVEVAAALGVPVPDIGQTIEPNTVTVETGGALQLYPQIVAGVQTNMTLNNNLFLVGDGVDHAFSLINHEGAVENLAGINSLNGYIYLNGVAGIGVEAVFGLGLTGNSIGPGGPGLLNQTSQLTTTGIVADTSPAPPGGGGITKLGSQRLIMQGAGTYTGPLTVAQGVLRLQNSTAVGVSTTGTTSGSETYTTTNTTVQPGAALELASSIAALNGGISAGLNIRNEHLILNSAGYTDVQTLALGGSGTFSLTFNGFTTGPLSLASLKLDADIQAALAALPSVQSVPGAFVFVTRTGPNVFSVDFQGALASNPPLLIGNYVSGTATAAVTGNEATLVNLDGDSLWADAVTFEQTAAFDVAKNSRLSIMGSIDDRGSVSGLTKIDTGELVLGGVSSYRGITHIGLAKVFGDAADVPGGIVTLEANQALGASTGAFVTNNATLQLQGNIIIGGVPLTVQGNGVGSAPSHVPLRWFDVGPAPTDNGQTPGSQASSAPVTGVAVDPTDPRVMYISTAGGGAWKTVNAGLTWNQLFDAVAVQMLNLPADDGGKFTLTFAYNGNTATTGPIAINVAKPQLTAQAIQDALNAATFATIGGLSPVPGSVVVTQIDLPGTTTAANPLAFQITFGGVLSGLSLPMLVGTGLPLVPGGAPIPNPVVTDPAGVTGATSAATAVMYTGAIAVDPNNPHNIYVGTGNANSSNPLLSVAPNSYYGTGVYMSADSGTSWTLLTSSDGINPLYGLGVTSIVVDPGPPIGASPYTPKTPNSTTLGTTPTQTSTGIVYVATSDQITNMPTAPVLTPVPNGGSPPTPPALSGIWTLQISSTVRQFSFQFQGESTTPLEGSSPTLGRDIQLALDALPVIGQSGGWVAVTPLGPGPGTFTITFEGSLTGDFPFLYNFPNNFQPPLTVVTAVPGIYRFNQATPQVQTVTLPFLGQVGTYALTFTNPFTGKKATTTPISLSDSGPEMVADLTTALDQLPNMSWNVPVPGFYPPQIEMGTVTVTESTVDPLVFTVAFKGAFLAQQNLTAIGYGAYSPFMPIDTNFGNLTNLPLAPEAGYLNYPAAIDPSINFFNAGATPFYGLRLMTATGTASATPVVTAASTWTNLTQTPTAALFAAGSPAGADDSGLTFPQTSATWSSITLAYFDTTNPRTGHPPTPFFLPNPPDLWPGMDFVVPVLYAAVGNAEGELTNSVFRTEVPNLAPDTSVPTVWYMGKPTTKPDHEIQSLTFAPNGTLPTGDYTLSFHGQTTPPLPYPTQDLSGTYDTAAKQIGSALEALPALGGAGALVDVAEDPASSPTAPVFDILFLGAMQYTKESNIVATTLNPNKPTVTVAQVQAGTAIFGIVGSKLFPTGNFLTGIPINGNIQLTTFVAPNPPASYNPASPFALVPSYNQVTIYAAVTVPEDQFYPQIQGTLHQIYVSVNGGYDWNPVGTIPQFLGSNTYNTPPASSTRAMGWYDSTILATSPTTVFVAGAESDPITHLGTIFETVDGGATWQDITKGTGGSGPHTGEHAFAVTKTGQLLVAGDGGLWESNPSPTPANILWTDINGNLANALVNSVAVNPNDQNNMLAGLVGNGVALNTGSPAWQATSAVTDGDGGKVVFNPLNPSIAYAENVANGSGTISLNKNFGGGGPYSFNYFTFGQVPVAGPPQVDGILDISTDGGQTWAPTGLPNNDAGYFPYLIDNITPTRLLAGNGFDAIYNNTTAPSVPLLEESFDSGATWTSIGGAVAAAAAAANVPALVTLNALAISTYQGNFTADPRFPLVTELGPNIYDPNTIYVAGQGFNPITQSFVPELYVSKNHGTTWQYINPAQPGFGTVQAIAVDPFNRDTVYVVCAGAGTAKMFVSTDAGQNWRSASGNSYSVAFQAPGPRNSITADASGLTTSINLVLHPELKPTVTVVTTQVGSAAGAAGQSVTFGGIVTGGTFTLIFNGQTTAPIPWSANTTTLSANIQNAVNLLFSTQIQTGFAVNVALPSNGQIVVGVQVTNPGSGYTTAPIVHINGGGGSGAAATAFLATDGELSGIIVTSAGQGYTSAPTVTFTGGGGGSGAGATAYLPGFMKAYGNGEVFEIDVTDGGSGYDPLNPPTVTINDLALGGAPPARATATAHVNAAGEVDRVTMVNMGTGYTPTTTTVGFSAPTGANPSLAKAVADVAGILTSTSANYLPLVSSTATGTSPSNQVVTFNGSINGGGFTLVLAPTAFTTPGTTWPIAPATQPNTPVPIPWALNPLTGLGTSSLFAGPPAPPITQLTDPFGLAANVQAALDTLLPSTARVVFFTFPADPLTVDGTGLTGINAQAPGTAPPINVLVNSTPIISFYGDVTGGTFTITDTVTGKSAPVNWSLDPATLQSNIQLAMDAITKNPGDSFALLPVFGPTDQAAPTVATNAAFTFSSPQPLMQGYGNGQLVAILVKKPGSGFSVGDQIFVQSANGAGYGASAKVSAVDATSGAITGIQIVTGGSGYTAPPILTFKSANISATVTASIAGILTGSTASPGDSAGVYVQPAPFSPIPGSLGTITGAAETTNVVTLTFAAAPIGATVGQLILVSGFAPAGYNGIFAVTGNTGKTLTYTANVLGLAASTTQGVAALEPVYSRQNVAFTGSINGGSFTLLLNPYETLYTPANPPVIAKVAWSADQNVLQTALASIPGVPIASVAVSTTADVYFVSNGTQNPITGNATGLSPGTASVTGATPVPGGAVVNSEVQSITITGGPGSFTLSFTAPATLGGASATTGSFSSTDPLLANKIKAALNNAAFASIGAIGGSVTVTQTGKVLVVTFGGALAGMQLNLLAVTIPTSPPPTLPFNVVVGELNAGTTTPAIETITLSGVSSGTFTLTFNGSTTQPISWNGDPVSQAANIQNALNGLFQTEIAGANALPDVPTFALAVDPRNGNLYAGSENGVYHSIDGGNTWQRFGQGLPNVQVRDIQLNTALNTLTIATYGRGVYEFFLAPPDLPSGAYGAVRAVSGTSEWTGPVQLLGDPVTNTLTFRADGTQVLQNGISYAQLSILGPVSELVPGSNPQLNKDGDGNLTLAGASSATGVNEVKQGVLVVANPLALGAGLALTTEVQSLTILGGPGTFKLSFTAPGSLGGATDTTVSFSSTDPLLAADIQAALNAATFASIGKIGGTVTVNLSGNVLYVNFGGTLAGLPLNPLVPTNLTFPPLPATFNLVEHELVAGGNYGGTIVDAGLPTVGVTFVLTATPTPLTVDVAPLLGTNFKVVVDTSGGAVQTITFQPLLTSDYANITGGYFNLTFNGQTLPVVWSADPTVLSTNVQTALDALAGPDSVTVYANLGAALELKSDLQLEPVQLNGNGITFNGHNTGALRNISNNNTYTGTLTLATNSTIGVDSGTSLDIGFSPAIPGAGTITDNGNTLQLTKELTGTLILANINTYGGLTIVNQGALQVQNALALGGTVNGTIVLDGAQLQLQTPSVGPFAGQPVVVKGEPLTLSGTGINTTGALLDTGGNNVWGVPSDVITLTDIPGFAPDTAPNGVVAFGVTNVADTLTVNAAVAETMAFQMGLSKVGPGTVILTNANLYSGTTYVNQGNLDIQYARALSSTNTPEVQRVTVMGPTSTGRFTLNFNGQITKPLAVGASAAAVQAALDKLINIGFPTGFVNVVMTAILAPDGNTIYVYTVQLLGTLDGVDEQPMIGLGTGGASVAVTTVADGTVGTVVNTGAALELDGAPAAGGFISPTEPLTLNGYGPAALQSIAVTGTVGTFTLTLTYNGVTSTTPALDVTSATLAADIQTDLNNLPSIKGVGGSVIVTPTAAGPFAVAFGGGLAIVPVGAITAAPTAGVTVNVTVLTAGAQGALRNLTGNNIYNGPITLATDAAIGVDSGLTFTVQNGGPGLNGVIQDPYPLISSAGIQTGGSGYSLNDILAVFGGIFVQPAQLLVNSVDAFGAVTGMTVIQGGSYQAVPGNAVTVTGGTGSGATFNLILTQPVPAPSFGKVGPGTLVLPTANTYSGRTFVDNGILNIHLPASLGDGLPELQQLAIVGSNGTFTLTFNGSTTNPFTHPLNINAPTLVSDIQSALNDTTMASIYGVGGSVTVLRIGTTNFYQILFNGTLAHVNVPQITATPNSGVTIAVTTLRDGPDGTTVNSGGTLQIQNNITIPVASGQPFGEPLTLNGTGYLGRGALENLTGFQDTWASPITLGSNSTIAVDDANPANNLILSNAIGDNGSGFGVTKIGPGVLSYIGSANNTYTGTTFVNGGLLELNKSLAITSAAVAFGGSGYKLGDTLTVQNGVATTAAQLVVTSVDSSGAVTGVYVILGGGTYTVAPTNSVSVTGGAGTLATFNLTSAQIALAGPLTVGAGIGVPLADVARELQNNQIADTSAVTVKSDGYFDLNNLTDTVGAFTIIGKTALATTGTGASGGALTVSSLTISDGTLTAQADNSQVTVNGTTRMTGGIITLPGANSLLTLGGDVTATSDVSTGTATISGQGTVSLGGAATRTFTVNAGTQTTDMLITSVITPSVTGGTDGLTKAGPGLLQLGTIALPTAESYTGTTTINKGILLVDGSYTGLSQLNGGTLQVDAPSGTIGPVTLAGGTLDGTGTTGAITSAAGGGVVHPGDTPSSIAVLNSGSVSWNSATNFNVVLDGTFTGLPTTAANLLNVNGTVDLGTAILNANLAIASKIGDVFTIITATGNITGSFGNTIGTGTGPFYIFLAGQKFQIITDDSGATKTVVIKHVPADTVTTLSSSVNPSVYGQNVTFTAIVTPEVGATGIPPGSVDFFVDGNDVKTVTLTAGVATYTTNTLAVPTSPHTVNAVFTDAPTDGYFNGSISNTVVQVVKKAPTVTTVTSNHNPSVWGQPVTFTATISSASSIFPPGTVDFYVDGVNVDPGVTVTSGVATYTTSSLSVTAGTPHVIAAFYVSTDGNFFNSNSKLPGGQTVNKADTGITVASTNAASAVYGEPVITATVAAASPGAGSPTGTVTFYVNGVSTETDSLAIAGTSQVATMTKVLSPGSYSITARYSGDVDFNTNTLSNTLAELIAKASTSVVVSSDASTSVAGQPVTFSAVISAVSPGGTAPGSLFPAGTASLKIDGVVVAGFTTTVVAGKVTFTSISIITVNGSPHSVEVDYNGDTNYAAGSVGTLPGGQTVKQDTVSVTVASSANPSVFGQPVTFSATITPAAPGGGSPGGTASLVIDSMPIYSNVAVVNGAVTFLPALSSLSVKTHTVHVVYNGDPNYITNSADLFQGQTVAAAATQTTVSADINPAVYGQVVTFTATVSAMAPSNAVPTGAVVFFIDKQQVSPTPIPLSVTGVATFQTSSLATPLSVAGHIVTAVYTNADGSFLNSTGTLAGAGETIKQASTVISVASTNSTTAVYGEPIVTATINAKAPGAGAPTGTVSFSIGNGTTTVTEMNDVIKTIGGKQVATLRQVLAPGIYSITATYSGDTNFVANAISNTLGQPIARANTTITVSSGTNPSVTGQPVTFSAVIAAESPGGSAAGSSVPNGTAFLVIDGKPVAGSTATVANGQVSFVAISSLTVVGSAHSIEVDYSGDVNFATGSGTLTGGQTVNKDGVSVVVASNANPAVFGQPVTFSATVTAASPGAGSPGGTADLFIDGHQIGGDTTVTGGQVSFPATASFLTLTSTTGHSVQVVYNGDPSFSGNSAFLTNGEKVGQAATQDAVSADTNPAVFGQVVTFTATVSAQSPSIAVPSGSVLFFIDSVQVSSISVPISAGKATFQTSSLGAPLSVGGSPHSVTVFYSNSDGNFTGSNGSLTGGATVNKASTTVAVASTNTSAVYGEPVISATVTALAPGAGTPTSTVTFFVNGSAVETDALQTAGGHQVATMQTTVLTPGTYSIAAQYNGDTSFLANSVSNVFSQTVTQATAKVAVTSSANPSVAGQPVTFSAIISAVSPGGAAAGSSRPGGTATLKLDGVVTGTATSVVNGQVSFAAVSSLSVTGSTHSVQIIYNGDSNYLGGGSALLTGGQGVNQDTVGVVVSANASPSVFGQQVVFSASINPAAPGGGSPGGTADLFIDGHPIGGDTTVTGGQVSFPATAAFLSVTGSNPAHSIQVVYNGDTSYVGNNAFLTGGQIVRQANTTTTVSSSSPSSYGQAVTFTATVSAASPGAGTPSGNVRFYDGTAFLGVGTLNQATTDQAVFTTTALQLTGGDHTINAVYQSDANFVGSQGPTTQHVNADATSTSAITSNNTNAVYGQSITFTAKVSSQVSGVGVPTGTMNFYDGPANTADLIGAGTVDASGKATLTLPSTTPLLPAVGAGSNAITAVYQGDINFAASTSPQLNQVVAQASTSSTLTSDTLPSAVYGQETIKAIVADSTLGSTGTPTGNVLFSISAGSTTLASQTVALVNGVAVLTAPASVLNELTAGGSAGTTYTISAAYQGDTNFTVSTSGSLSQKITQAGTTATLSASPSTNSSVTGQPVTFTAVIAVNSPGAGVPTGTVKFYNGPVSNPANLIGTQPLSVVGTQDLAALTVTNLPASALAEPITAVYQGDTSFLSAQSNTVNFTVGQAGTATAVSSSTPTSTYGQPVTLTATVTVTSPGGGVPTGSVGFHLGSPTGALLGTGALNLNQAAPDQAAYTTTAVQLGAGNFTVFAVYLGDNNYTTSQASTPQTVQHDSTTTTLLADSPTPVVGRPHSITATVGSAPAGLAITGGTVSFTVDGGAAQNIPLNSAGQSVLIVSFSALGGHTINAIYTGDANFLTSTAATVTVNVLTPIQGFVAQVYRDLLHREVDPGGLASWSRLIAQGVLTHTQFAQAIQSSPEYRADVVDAIYVHYLHRHADGGGITFFAGLLATGTTDEQIAALLIGSQEYYVNRGGGTVAGFLTVLYNDTLNRAPDPGGLQSFTQALSFNVSRQQVAAIVLGTYEYKSNVVTADYNQLFHRNPDSGGLSFWANKLAQGLTDEQLVAVLVGSDEYFNAT